MRWATSRHCGASASRRARRCSFPASARWSARSASRRWVSSRAAWSGLAGPLWGLGAALAALGIHLATGAPIWAAIARFGAWVNLFNLLPFWQLDGGRGFRALTRRQRWLAVAALGGIWFLTAEPLLFLLGLAGVANALSQAPEEGDNAMLGLYAALALLLALVSRLPVATGTI